MGEDLCAVGEAPLAPVSRHAAVDSTGQLWRELVGHAFEDADQEEGFVPPAEEFQRTGTYALHSGHRFRGAVDFSRFCVAASDACVRGDIAPVHLGRFCFLGEDCIVRPPIVKDGDTVTAIDLTFGDNVFIGAHSVVEAAVVGSSTVIEKDCIIGPRCVIGDGVRIIANSVVPPHTTLPSFSVYEGNPAVCVARYSPEAALHDLRQVVQDAVLSLKLFAFEVAGLTFVCYAAARAGTYEATPVAMTDLLRDPRTDLELVGVPPEHSKYFGDLRGSLIHWFGVVDKFNRMWQPQRRVAIISDQCLYLCRLDGGITRCMRLENLVKLIVSEEGRALGFQASPPDYDMVIAVSSADVARELRHIIGRIHAYLAGEDLLEKELAGDATEGLQSALNLTKPKGYTLKVEPLKTVKGLKKHLMDQEKKERQDKGIVEAEFERIKAGLRQELESYHSEEYDRMLDQLALYVRTLDARDREIETLRKEVTRHDQRTTECPNCARHLKALESDNDKQKILQLERQLESQRKVVEHLQEAIRTGAQAKGAAAGAARSGGLSGPVDGGQVQLLQAELSDARQKNKQLQQLVLESPFLTADVRQKVASVGAQREGAGSTASHTARDWEVLVTEKEREVSYLKGLLRDVTEKHVQEIDSVRQQFKGYDKQLALYLERVFAGRSDLPAGTPAEQAQDVLVAAKRADPSSSAVPFSPSVRSGFLPPSR